LHSILIFDEIINNSNLRPAWSIYRKSMKSMRGNLSHFGSDFSRNSVDGIESVLDDLNWLIEAKAFQELFDNVSEIRSDFHGKSVSYFSAHLLMYIKSKYAELEKMLPNLSDVNETQEILRLTLVCGLYHQLFGNLDQKYIRNVLELNNKHQGITLIGNSIWCWETFVRTHFPTLLKGANEKYATDATKQRRLFLQGRVQTLVKETQTYGVQICNWVYKMHTALKVDSSTLKLEHLRQRCNLFLQGLQFAGQISQIVKSTANLCIFFKQPMQKSCVLAICKLVEFLKIIKSTFEVKQHVVADSVQCICRYLEYQALFILQSVKKKVTSEVSTNYNERSIDVLSALQIAEKAFYGPGTVRRTQVFRLAIGLADPASTFSIDYQSKLQKILFRLDVIANLQAHVSKSCDSTFLYWHQSLLPIYLKSLLESNQDLQKVQYIVHSTTDCSEVMLQNHNLDQTLKEYQDTFVKAIEEQVIGKLEANIETFLRLDHHSNLQLEKFNPFNNGASSNMELYEKGKLLIQLRAMNVFGRHLLMKDYIEQYLSEMFYNLTTVTLYDWKTYGEIRCLARSKFDLTTTEDLLPTQQLEQGLDILEIMRNIHVFVGTYLYNLNNQIFIEASTTTNKHLNTINIRHVANSLRTHGSGIINTTVRLLF
jgi:WASH complex subunit 7